MSDVDVDAERQRLADDWLCLLEHIVAGLAQRGERITDITRGDHADGTGQLVVCYETYRAVGTVERVLNDGHVEIRLGPGVSDGTHPAPTAQASAGSVKINVSQVIKQSMADAFDDILGRALRGPAAEEAADAAQASLVALVHDLTAARRRSESLQDQIAYLQERYWIVPKAAG